MKRLIFLITLLMMAGFVSATTEKQNRDTELILNCNDCTSVFITKIQTPNNDSLLEDIAMTQKGTKWVYTLDKSYVQELGEYRWHFNATSSSGEVAANSISFEVTPSGQSGTSNIVLTLLIILVIYAITFIGFFGRNEIITLIGGMFMIALSIYLINQGIIVYRDWITNYFSYITAGLGLYFTMAAGFSLME